MWCRALNALYYVLKQIYYIGELLEFCAQVYSLHVLIKWISY